MGSSRAGGAYKMPADRNFEQEYLARLRANALAYAKANAHQASEGGGSGWDSNAQEQFDSLWDGMTLTQALQQGYGQTPVDGRTDRFGEIALDEDDPLVQQWISQYGGIQSYTDENGNPIERPDFDNAPAQGLVMGYGEPRYGNASGVEILANGDRILYLPDGRYIREQGNLNSGEVAGQHRGDETETRRMRQRGAMAMGAVVAGGLAAGAAGVGATGGGATGGSGFGVTASGSGGIGAGASGGAALDLGGVAAAGGTAGAGAGATPTAGSGLGVTGGGSGGVGAGATGAATAPSGGGFIGNTISSVSNWYSGLSPASRMILNTAVSTGASALAQGAAQREQQRFIQEQQDEQEADRIRRGRIPDFSGAFKPRSTTPQPGIIGSRRGG